MCSEQGYVIAYNLAREKLAGMDVKQQCLNSGAQCVAPNKVLIEYLGSLYVISLPSAEISLGDGEEEIPISDKILLLHYLTLAKGTPATDKLIAFRQLSGGVSYLPAFSQRTMAPLLRYFGKEPELLVDAAQKLGGYKANYGDVAVRVMAFPRVPVTIILWRGDVEFAPSATLIFDSTISDYLSTEDICVLCETIVRRLINLSKNLRTTSSPLMGKDQG